MLVSFVVVNLISYYSGFSYLSNVVTIALIPGLLFIYFSKQKIMSSVFILMFALYYLGMIFKVLLKDVSLSSELSQACVIASYSLLVFIMMGKLKHVRLDGLVWSYLVMLLLVNSYLMYQMVSTVTESFQNNVSLTLTVIQSVVLMVMMVLAFAIYLSKESAQSILLLTFLSCFAFSDALGFITSLIIPFWLFEGAQNIFQGLGVLMLCLYVYDLQETVLHFPTKDSRLEMSHHFAIES